MLTPEPRIGRPKTNDSETERSEIFFRVESMNSQEVFQKHRHLLLFAQLIGGDSLQTRIRNLAWIIELINLETLYRYTVKTKNHVLRTPCADFGYVTTLYKLSE